LETVDLETPAAAATSWIVGALLCEMSLLLKRGTSARDHISAFRLARRLRDIDSGPRQMRHEVARVLSSLKEELSDGL